MGMLAGRCFAQRSGSTNNLLRAFSKPPEIPVKFSELLGLLKRNGYEIVKEKGSIRCYGKAGWDRLIRVDYYGAKEFPSGTCNSILRAAGIEQS